MIEVMRDKKREKIDKKEQVKVKKRQKSGQKRRFDDREQKLLK